MRVLEDGLLKSYCTIQSLRYTRNRIVCWRGVSYGKELRHGYASDALHKLLLQKIGVLCGNPNRPKFHALIQLFGWSSASSFPNMGPHHSSRLLFRSICWCYPDMATPVSRERWRDALSLGVGLHRFPKADFDYDAALYIIVPKPSMKPIPASNAMRHYEHLTGQQFWGGFWWFCCSLRCAGCQSMCDFIGDCGGRHSLPSGSLIRGNLTARGLGLNGGFRR